jgi:hypothetical protein
VSRPYPRWQHAIIDGAYANRIIQSPEQEEPDVWKESPAHLIFPTAGEPPAAAAETSDASSLPDAPANPPSPDPAVAAEPAITGDAVPAPKRGKRK